MRGKNNNFWLDDDPEWHALRRKADKRAKPDKQPPKLSSTDRLRLSTREASEEIPPKSYIAPPRYKSKKVKSTSTPVTSEKVPVTPNKKAKTVDVSVKLSIPHVHIPRPSGKQLKLVGVAAVVVLVGFLGISFWPDKPQAASEEQKDVLASADQKPPFDTIAPEGKEDNAAQAIKYDAEKKVASFTDEIGTAKIVVSQQELPQMFKEDTDTKVERLAKDYNANEVLRESNPKAYLGTDEKGPQTVIFHKNGLLIFIQSSRTLDKDQWADYITRLL